MITARAFAGNHYAVYGLARSGIATAEALLASGAKVTAWDAKEEARAAFERLAPGRSFGLLLDVTDQGSVREGVEEALRRPGGIDVLVNNAGYGLEGAIEEVSLDQVRDQFAVNVFGAVSVIQAVLPHMRRRRAGHIVNITSMGGLTSFAGVGIYCGSKFALVGLSESFRAELLNEGIYVTTVCPGLMRTGSAGNAWFKGKNEQEAAWFTVSSSAPLATIAAERAASTRL